MRLIKPVTDALFALLVGSIVRSFTADVVADDATLTDVSDLTGLFAGLPVFGEGLAHGTVVVSIDVSAGTVTLSEAPAADGNAVAFTTGFLTTGRRVAHWSSVPNQPAFFLRRIGMTDESDHENFYDKTTIEYEGWLYSKAGQDPEAAPDDELTAIEQALRDAFVPDGDYGDPRCTLGGLVHWARIEGRSDISSGDQGPQAIARIPIRVTIP